MCQTSIQEEWCAHTATSRRTARSHSPPRAFFSWMGVFSIFKAKKAHKNVLRFFFHIFLAFACKTSKKSFVLLFLLFVFQESDNCVICQSYNRCVVFVWSVDFWLLLCRCKWRACALPAHSRLLCTHSSLGSRSLAVGKGKISFSLVRLMLLLLLLLSSILSIGANRAGIGDNLHRSGRAGILLGNFCGWLAVVVYFKDTEGREMPQGSVD